MPPLVLELSPSRWPRAGAGLVALAALAAAVASPLPPLLSAPLALLAAAAAWRAASRPALQRLALAADGSLRWQQAGGTQRTGRIAGYAVLGHVALFIRVENPGRRRPRRLVVLRDALDADGFRRLRARLRLAPQGVRGDGASTESAAAGSRDG